MDSRFKNYLTATIKVPVKFNIDGEFIMLDDYADIKIEPMVDEPNLTFDSISEKLIEYIRKNPTYLSNIVAESNIDAESNIVAEMHEFPVFKRSKKPLNVSFRKKGAKHNFTKKNYE